MNRRDKLIILNILLCVGLVIFIDYMFALSHERVHEQIFESYGLKSQIQISFFGRLFKGENAYTLGESCRVEACNLAHNINEAIGYQIQWVLFTIIFVYLIGSTIYLVHKDIEEEKWKELLNK